MTETMDNQDLLEELGREIVQLANGQFDSPQFRRLLSLPLNRARAQAYVIQRTHWTVNRRDCWALVQGVAPLDVKKIIWDHEREELDGKPDEGVDDHYTLSIREGAALGLTAEDFTNILPFDGAVTCMAAWLHLAKHSHWLTALAASAALELSNSEEILKNGSMSRRMGEKLERELGIPMKAQASNAEHAVADIAHGNLLSEVAKRHVTDRKELELVYVGLRESWAIDRVWKGQLAELMESIPL